MRSESTRRVGRLNQWGFWGCAALAIAAGSASAQSGRYSSDPYNAQTGQQSYNQPTYRPNQGMQGQSSQSWRPADYIPQLANFDIVHLSKEQNNKTTEVTIENGRVVAAQVDGQFIPPDQVQVRGNTLRVQDPESRMTTQIRIPNLQSAMGRSQGGQQFGTNEPFDPNQQQQWQGQQNRQNRMHSGMGMQQDATAVTQALGFAASEAAHNELQRTSMGSRYDQAIRVDRVFNSTPADDAGLRRGDLIVAIDGRQPVTWNTFQQVVTQKDQNDQVRLTVLRDANQRTITIPLDQVDVTAFQTQGQNFQPGFQQQQGRNRVFGTTGGSGNTPVLGIQMTEANPTDLSNTAAGNRYSEGIRVENVEQGLPAATSGLQDGDIIVSIDGRTPATTQLLRQRLAQKSTGDTLQLGVIRAGQERTVNVRLSDTSGRSSGGTSYSPGREETGEEVDPYLVAPNKMDTYKPSEDRGNRNRNNPRD